MGLRSQLPPPPLVTLRPSDKPPVLIKWETAWVAGVDLYSLEKREISCSCRELNGDRLVKGQGCSLITVLTELSLLPEHPVFRWRLETTASQLKSVQYLYTSSLGLFTS